MNALWGSLAAKHYIVHTSSNCERNYPGNMIVFPYFSNSLAKYIATSLLHPRSPFS